VREAQSLTTAPNAKMIATCLKWYEHWCAEEIKESEASGTLRGNRES
jgi:hypothetical protein